MFLNIALVQVKDLQVKLDEAEQQAMKGGRKVVECGQQCESTSDFGLDGCNFIEVKQQAMMMVWMDVISLRYCNKL